MVLPYSVRVVFAWDLGACRNLHIWFPELEQCFDFRNYDSTTSV